MGVEGTNNRLRLINLVSDVFDIYMVGTAPQCLVLLSFSFAVEYLQNLQDTQKMSMKCAVFICHSHTILGRGVSAISTFSSALFKLFDAFTVSVMQGTWLSYGVFPSTICHALHGSVSSALEGIAG